MANRTVKDAKSVHGTNPQYLVEKIIRSRIYDCKYWKEECFALTAELLVDKAMELRYVGGVYGGNIKPTPFICLILKMLQIQPEKDIIVEFIKNDEFKYVRALGAYYLRLTGTSLDCYNYLEPLLNDYRKLRRQNRAGAYELVYMDDFVSELLCEDRVCDVILPRLQKRYVLEQNNELLPRVSTLEDEDDDDEDEPMDEDDDDMEEGEARDEKPSSSGKSSSSKDKSRRDRDSGGSRHHHHHHHDKKKRRDYSSEDDDDEDDYNRRRKKDRKTTERSSKRDSSRSPSGRRTRDEDYYRDDRGRNRRGRSSSRDRSSRRRSRSRDYYSKKDDNRGYDGSGKRYGKSSRRY